MLQDSNKKGLEKASAHFPCRCLFTPTDNLKYNYRQHFIYARTQLAIRGNRESDQRLCFRYTESTLYTSSSS